MKIKRIIHIAFVISTTLFACQKKDFTNVESNNEVKTNMKSLHKKVDKYLVVSEIMKYIGKATNWYDLKK